MQSWRAGSEEQQQEMPELRITIPARAERHRLRGIERNGGRQALEQTRERGGARD